MKKTKFRGLDEFLYSHKLKNGLEVYMVPNSKVKNFYITYSTKFGSLYTEFKNENDKEYIKIPDGVAHFLEHLTFKMKDSDASSYFSSIGSSSNAYTSFKVTCYEVMGHDKFKENLKYLLKFVNTPYYTEENVSAEKGIISEEVKTSKDNPYTNAFFGLNKCLFKNDKRRNLVCGEVKDVLNTSIDDIKNAYNYFYNPANMFIIITGNFNPEEALSIIEEEMIKYKLESMNVIVKELNEPLDVNKKLVEEKDNIESSKLSIGLKLPINSFKSLNISKLELSIYLSIILNSNFGHSSLLKEELITGNVINYPFSIDKYFTDKYIILSLVTETEYPNRVINIVKEKFNSIDLTEEDFKRKIRVFISNYIQAFDDIEMINDSILDDVIEYEHINTELFDVYNNLNYDTALKVLKKIKSDNMAIHILNKKDE